MRAMVLSCLVCVCVLKLGVAQADGAPPDLDAATRAIAAAVRVGDSADALARLKALPEADDDDRRRVWTILTARAELLAKRPEAARRTLSAQPDFPGHGRTQLDDGLGPAVAYLALRAARARRDDDGVLEAAALLGGTGPTAWGEAARLWVAEVLLKRPDDVARARRDLVALVEGATEKAARTQALALLAAHHPDVAERHAAKRTLLVRFPASEAARRLGEAALGRLSMSDRVLRAEALYSARAYTLLEPELDRIVESARTTPLERQRAHLRAAISRMRLRERHREALAQLEMAAKGPDARITAEVWYRKGLVLGRLARWDEAIVAMKRAAKLAPKTHYGRAAAYQAGRLLHEAGRFEEAIDAQKIFLKRRHRDQAKWRWFLGWSHFRAGDYPGARAVFKRLVGSKNILVGAKALYWTARCHLAEGDSKAAHRALSTLALRAPLGYYGLLGEVLFEAQFPKEASPFRHRIAATPRPLQHPRALRTIEETLSGTARRTFRRLRQRVEAGYPGWARAVKFRPRRRSRGMTLALDLALERYGARWKRTAKGRLPWVEDLAAKPAKAPLAYPAAYLDLAKAAGRMHDVSPYWLLAHMLQESRYKARAKSHAGALGAMQVLPRTGRRIAPILDFPSGDFFDSQLYDPGLSLRHAAWYLEALQHELGGVQILAIAGYNGGPRRMAAHLKARHGLPFDVMMEELGAHETRNYARKVTDHLLRYAAIYASPAARERIRAGLRPGAETPTALGELRF